MNKAEINQQLQNLLNENSINKDIQKQANDLFVDFSEMLKQSEEEQKQKFLNDGGDIVEFTYSLSEEDQQFNNLKTTFSQRLEKQKSEKKSEREQSLTDRKQIIKELEAIVKTDVKNLGKHFRKANELQERWKATKHYDADEFNELESQYKNDLDKFYYNANIAKDAIELDYQKNLVAKEKVLQKIRDLVSETDVNTLERRIRQYEKEWYRVGPVKREIRDESKQKLADVVASLNPTLDKLYEDQKEILQENLQKKIKLCEQLNELLGVEYNSPKKLQEASDKVIALQNEWKEIGRSEEQDRIWDVFNSACDSFFDSKRAFFHEIADNRKENKNEKEKLIKQAESKADSTDWRKTSNYLIQLQKQWKKIGPAHPAEDQKLWNRFRKACDRFFDSRSEYYKERDKEYEKNLDMKNTLIQQLKDFTISENTNKDIEKLQAFEKEYKNIGFVPFKQKDKVHKAFFSTLNKHYESLNIDRKEKAKMRFESKVKAMATGRKPDKTLNYEKNKIRQQMKELENKLAQYENNFSIVSGKKDNPLLKGILKDRHNTEKKLERLQMQLGMVNEAKAGKFDEEE